MKYSYIKISLIIQSLILLFSLQLSSQTVSGTFSGLGDHKIKLTGFDGFKIYTIDSIIANSKGEFQLKYGKKDYGMGYLAAEDIKAFIVILAENEDIILKGEVLSLPQKIIIQSGKQNQQFEKYATEQPLREQALSAWDYLTNLYQSNSIFLVQNKSINAINDEIKRLKDEENRFLNGLEQGSYVRWFLPVRKLVSSVQILTQYRSREIPDAISQFRSIDYSDNRLYKSGLFREAIESHFWLIENSGKPIDTVFADMKTSIDKLIEDLADDEIKMNEVTDFLFRLLERQSLFNASEYLAVKVLTETSCTLNQNLASQLESYRAMKIGNIAPDISFEGDVYKSGISDLNNKHLSDIKSEFKLIIFGASWCPKCNEELTLITQLYSKCKMAGLEVIFVSLDSESKEFDRFIKTFPFFSTCDFKKWDSKAAEDYHIFATPTMFLLNSNHEIVLRPNNVKQVEEWVNMKLTK